MLFGLLFFWQAAGVDAVHAQAEDRPDGESAVELRERAKALFTAATADFGAGRYREALHGFEQAARALPSAELWFNIGRAHEELGQLEAAVSAFRRYLRDAVDPPDRDGVEAKIARLTEAQLAQSQAVERARPLALLRVEVTPELAQVSLDGTSLGAAPIDRWLSLAPGKHALRVDRAGYVPSLAQLELEPGTVSVAQAKLSKLSMDAESLRPTRLWTWIAFGVGGAALVASGALAVAAAGDSSAASADALGSARDATLAAALGLGMLGALLYVVEGAHEARDVAAR